MFILLVFILGLIFSGSTLLGESLINGFIWVEYFYMLGWAIFAVIAVAASLSSVPAGLTIFALSSIMIGINYLIVDYIIGLIPPNASAYADLSPLSVVMMTLWAFMAITSQIINTRIKNSK